MSPEVESEHTKIIQSGADTLAQATDAAHFPAASTTNSRVVAHDHEPPRLSPGDAARESGVIR